ncbi:MAG TPA: sporulation membrane protein YtaF [bacterium]|jgi:putative sporulation protein YtaF|nr:sporulation membrane protein YtaF [bacterium]
MAWLSTLTLVLAISLDSLGVGFAYGLQKVIVPTISLILLSLVSAFSMLISMMLGHGAGFLLGEAGAVIGNSILILVGLLSLRQGWLCNKRQLPSKSGREGRTMLELVTRVTTEPLEADIDSSGEISAMEALLLGMALALDSLGAGFGAALTAFSPLITSFLAGLSTWVTLNLGLYAGRRIRQMPGSWLHLIPGLLLITLGIYRFMGC